MKRSDLLIAGGFFALTLCALAPAWGEGPNRKATNGVKGAPPALSIAQQSPQQGPTSGIVPHSALGLSTRLVAGYGELVASISPGDKAEQMGIRTGDVIQAVNGAPTTAAGALAKSLTSGEVSGLLTLKIRDGRSGEVTYRSRGR